MTQQKTSPTEGPGATAWHSMDAEAVLTRLHTDSRHGLSTGEAASRLQQQGPNALETGRIAQLTQTIGRGTTPLQQKLGVLGKQLGIFSVAISVVVAVTGWLLGKPLLEMFMTGVSLAVAVVPVEGKAGVVEAVEVVMRQAWAVIVSAPIVVREQYANWGPPVTSSNALSAEPL